MYCTLITLKTLIQFVLKCMVCFDNYYLKFVNNLVVYITGAFGPPSPNHKNHSNGTIVLRSGKLKGRKKKNVFKNACRIL